MARPKKTTEPIDSPDDSTEVELNDLYKGHTGVILSGRLISFVDNKAIVHKDTAEKLRINNIIK